MESLRHALFEDPTYVYVSLGLAELALAAVWHSRRGARWLAALLVPIVLAAGVFVTERLVVTDREQIFAAMKEIADGIADRDFAAVAGWIDEDLTGYYAGKAQAVAAGRRAAERYDVRSVGYLNPRLAIDGGRARLRVTTVVSLRAAGDASRTVLTWDIRWVKREQGWRIREVGRPKLGADLGLN